jgi:hypothetical protein
MPLIRASDKWGLNSYFRISPEIGDLPVPSGC